MAQRHDLYFFAYPPPSVAAAAAALWCGRRSPLEAHGNGQMPADRLHITLHPLGQFMDFVPLDVLDLARAVGAAVDEEPFDVAFDRLQSRNRTNVPGTVELAGHGPALRQLRRFQRCLGDTMRGKGFAPPAVRTSFFPHITLDYKHMPVVRQTIAPMAWRVTKFFLVDSLHGQGRHDVLAEWTLNARQREFSDWETVSYTPLNQLYP